MSRPPVFRAYRALPGELVVDNFAGGGGASTGIEAALGRPVDIAINHSPEAIAVHAANHRETKHYCEDIWEVDPLEAAAGRPVGLAWFSPDCTHFSRAKGTTPLKKEIRGLAWVVIRWAKAVHPRVILLENVEEFQTWGPLTDDNRPDPSRVGETFRQWLAELTGLGYRVEYKVLVAADYGTPTTRKRLFLVARCDGGPIIWPDPTHGKGRGESWRPASEVIDWSLPCPSIFDRKKPLAEATLRRIAAGIRRYVIESGRPFIIRHGHYSTITGAGLHEGCGAGTFRGQRLEDPLATVCATNDKHLVVPYIAKHYGGEHASGKPKAFGADARGPLSTVTAKDHHALVSVFLTKFYGTSTGADLQMPLPTVTANGRGGGHIGIVMVHGHPYRIVDIGMRMLQPHELFAAQGFPDTYDIAPEFRGKPLTKTAQTALAGNSVCPPVARALVAANASVASRAA